MLSNQAQQIVTAFEVGHRTPDEIAEEFDVELIAVKATLYQYSSLYRESSKKDIDLKFNETERDEAKAAIVDIMRHSDDDYLRLRAAKYVRDDSEGRLDNPLKALKDLNVNISIFNQRLLEAKAARQRSQNDGGQLKIEDKSKNKVIDVEVAA